MDLSTPPPDLYGRPRADRFFERLTAFSDWYTPAMGRPGLRRNPRRPQTRPTPPLTVVVTSHEPIAADVVELRLADPSGAPLPGWQPGARILLTLPSGRERHYSLCGDPADRHFYRIAVRRIADGGGGSTEVHDELHAGVRLTVRRPRNGFAFCGEPRVLLLAGGIGITPLLPMARAARRAGVDWRLVHTAGTRRRCRSRTSCAPSTRPGSRSAPTTCTACPTPPTCCPARRRAPRCTPAGRPRC